MLGLGSDESAFEPAARLALARRFPRLDVLPGEVRQSLRSISRGGICGPDRHGEFGINGFEASSRCVGLWRSWERASMAWKRSSVRTRLGPPTRFKHYTSARPRGWR